MAPKPSEREQRFDIDELFFSRTDAKGIIRSGNEVFTRVSGFERDELIGKAHNIVRHPDMPRSLFRVFWDRLQGGNAVAAYVKNRAADGSHYWVLATVDHSDGGFVSVRLKPTSELFAFARKAYADVLAVEQRVEGGDVRRRKAAIDAGVERLQELLTGAGFPDYQAFIRAAVPAEVYAREALIGESAAARLGTPPEGGERALSSLLRSCAVGDSMLEQATADLERYTALHDTLAPKSTYVRQLSDDVRLFSLNALLKTTRLGDRGVALAAVAEIMRARSHTAGPVTDALGDDIAAAVDLLAGMGYRVAVSKLQTEMMMVFLHELLRAASTSKESQRDLQILFHGLVTGVERLCTSLADLGAHLGSLWKNAEKLCAELRMLGRLEINGRIEAARIANTEEVLDLFRTIGGQVVTANEQLAEFASLQQEHAVANDGVGERMRSGLVVLERQMAKLA